jgi:hypothetical protein
LKVIRNSHAKILKINQDDIILLYNYDLYPINFYLNDENYVSNIQSKKRKNNHGMILDATPFYYIDENNNQTKGIIAITMNSEYRKLSGIKKVTLFSNDLDIKDSFPIKLKYNESTKIKLHYNNFNNILLIYLSNKIVQLNTIFDGIILQ